MAEDVYKEDNLEKLLYLLQASDSRLNEASSASLSSSSTALEVRADELMNGLTVGFLGILRKDYYESSFEGRQCSCIFSNVDFFESHTRQLEFEQDPADRRTNESSHLQAL